MIEDQELTQRILAEVHEAGFEDLHAILNTVLLATGSPGEVSALARSLRSILQGKLGYLALERMKPQELENLTDPQAEELISNLDNWFRFDQEENYWTLGNGDFLKDRYPVLFLTREGIAKAREILEHRGSAWWVRRKR